MTDPASDPMNDEGLRRALAASPPPAPGEDARARALSHAMAAFDANTATAAQGNRAARRPRDSRPRGLAHLGRLLMTYLPSTRTLALGTGSLAALTVAVITTAELMRSDGALPLPRAGRDAPDIVLAPSDGPTTLHQAPAGVAEAPEAAPGGLAPPPAREEPTPLAAPSADDQLTPQGTPTLPRTSARATCIGTSAACSDAPPSPPPALPLRDADRQAAQALGGAASGAGALPSAPTAPAAQGLGGAAGGVGAQSFPAAAPSVESQAAPVIEQDGASYAAESGVRQAVPQAGVAVAPTAAPMPATGYGLGAAIGADAGLTGWREQGRDRFADIQANDVKVTAEAPVSTFSIDVDTASYSFVRGALMQGVLPPKDAVRVEELINYFPYDYAPPESRETPFAMHVTVTPTPWDPQTRLMRIGIQGYDIAAAERPRANLVFLIDTSGSMDAPEKLPLLLSSFRLLLDSLQPEDRVAIVAYAGSAGTVLEPTPVAQKATILSALHRLRAGGSTAGGEGIRQAYQLAGSGFDPQGVNRVILATDGDFNVGVASVDELQDFVERQRDSGVFLSVLGFGRGNLNDQLMQALAQNGNGQAAYIDTLSEARKTLVEEASSTLFPIASDVKVQVEFNPATVAEYRLIGYETRLLAREDFNNDRVDAGEIGAGHSVTALYEITPAGSAARAVDPLRYGAAAEPAAGRAVEPTAGGTAGTGQAVDARETPAEADGEYAFLKIRYKLPGETESRLIARPITPADEGAADAETRFAAAVAAFGQLLRGGEHVGDFGYDDVVRLASGARGDDPWGYRAEFVTLARLAASAAALEPQRR